MTESHDYQALEWVKDEIEKTLQEAQKSLEAHVDNPKDTTRMRFCLTHLHQVCRTLQMVEFYGAALLAEEMELLVTVFIDGGVKPEAENDALAVLMQGILQLPTYLERLMSGHSDMPVMIMSLLNDLRAVRGENLLSATPLFKPDMASGRNATPKENVSEEVKNNLPKLLKKVRQLYQFSLLGLIRNEDMPTNLGYLAKALAKLQQLYGDAPMSQLWWVGGAVIEGVSCSSIELGTSVKMLLGQLDRQLKENIESKADRMVTVPSDLLKNLLYYVARSDGKSPLIKAVKKAFSLDDALPQDTTADTTNKYAMGLDKEAMASAIFALLEELVSVKENLDLFLRGKNSDIDELKLLIPNLKKVADTLGVLSIGNLRRVIVEQMDIVGSIIEKNVLPEDKVFMDVAGALLFVEATLQGMAENGTTTNTPSEIEDNSGCYVSPEHIQSACSAVIDESRAGLERTKDAITNYIGSNYDSESLKVVPDILHSIRGGLTLVPLPYPAALLKSCAEYIQNELIEIGNKPDWETLDTLADAIASVEYYLERKSGPSASEAEDILLIAEASVKNLGYPVQYEKEKLLAVEDLTDNAPMVNFIADSSSQITPDETPVESISQNPEENVNEASAASDSAPEAVAEAVEDDDDLIDDELIEIFAEEAGEVLEAINEFSPQWKTDHSNEAARSEVRRAFHTLKGSGRMVGAQDIGELGWSVENMLNRVLDGTVDVSDAVFSIIDTVVSVTPELVECFSSRTQSTLNIDALMAVANAISEGKQPPELPADLYSASSDVVTDTPSSASLTTASEPVAEHIEEANLESADDEFVLEESEFEIETEDDEVVEQGEGIDFVLMDIFSQEAASHIEAVKDFVMTASASEPYSSELLRALHTLKGSAHMAGVAPIAEIATPLEKLIKESHLSGQMADTDVQSLLKSAVSVIEQGVAQLMSTPNALLEESEPLLEWIKRLAKEKTARAIDTKNVDDAAQPAPQLVATFLADSSDLILNAADILDHWEQNPVSGDDLNSLRRELCILSDSASAMKLDDIAVLCKALEDVYAAASEGVLSPTPELFKLAHSAHEQLIGTMDRIAVGQKTLCSESISAELRTLLENATQPDVSPAIPIDAAVEEPVDVPVEELEAEVHVDVNSIEEEEQDPELIEIFLEEANDIVESISNLLEAWQSAPESLDTVAELQRDLHTLKGGANMSGMTQIADLSHHLENLYEGLCEKTFAVVPALFGLLHQCHDALAVMVEAITAGAKPAAADDLIQQVERFMKEGASFVPDVVPVAQSIEPEIIPELSQDKISERLFAVADGEDFEDDPELLEIFLEEADDLSEQLDITLNNWLTDRTNSEPIDELKRLLHTFKGGARLSGQKVLGDISHDFETFIVQTEEAGGKFDDAFFTQVQDTHYQLVEALEQLRKQTASANTTELLDSVLAKTDAITAIVDSGVIDSETIAANDTIVIADAIALKPFDQREASAAKGSSESIRISADLVEQLVNLSGETSIIRGRVEQGLSDFSFDIDEIGMTIDRARELLRRLDIETETQILYGHQQSGEGAQYEGFDPLEMDRYSTLHQLSRSLSETASDLMDLKDSLSNRARDTETLLQQQARVNSELQEGLLRTRMEPFSRLVPRLRRIVRQVASELGKKAELEVIGAEGEMDRTVMDRITSPLEHMIRNAVDHGLETTEERIKAGKDETGRITLYLTREGGDVVLRLMDDGKGINMDAVKTRAIERGLMTASSPLSEKEIMQFIFKAGFSTAEKVTQISGRGVGMDVVHSEIKQLSGSIKLHSAPNAGSQFTIRLPFTVSVNRALMVRVGDDAYAIPLNHIEGIVRVSPYELEAYYQPDAPPFEYAGQHYNLKYLGGFVHGISTPNLLSHTKPLPVLLVRGGEQSIALQVDSLIASREIVVKSVGPQLSAVGGISGATILGDGSVVIILDLTAMMRAEHAQIGGSNEPRKQVEQQPADVVPMVMVIDDSVTVRKVTSRLLERSGFDVITAKDGIDAITQLQDIKPDIMLLDIEMPRMDGFEVATLVRHDDRLKDTPIIMITSRTGEKHRERAMDIGVNDYMGKPYQETVLLERINALLAVEESNVVKA